ncbi:MAG: hypothetical protein ABIQ15_14990, partial [Nocardioides sp.]
SHVATMSNPSVRRPDDLDMVRDSYDRVADNYASLVDTAGLGDIRASPRYGGVPVSWTTFQWQPEKLAVLVEEAGLRLVAELRLPPDGLSGTAVVLVAERDGREVPHVEGAPTLR